MWPLLSCYFFHLLVMHSMVAQIASTPQGRCLGYRWCKCLKSRALIGFRGKIARWIWRLWPSILRVREVIYGIATFSFFSFLRIKLSKLNFNSAECAETFIPFIFVHEPNQWYEIDLEFRNIFIQNGLLNTLLNSIKLIPQIPRHFRRNERFFLRLCVDHIHHTWKFQVISVSKYLQQNSPNLAHGITLIQSSYDLLN